MNFDLQVLSSFSGWEQLAQTGMSFGTNLLAALAIFFIGRWIATRLVTLMKAALTRAKVDKTLVSFLGNVANIGQVANQVAGGADEASQASAELTRLAEQQRRLVNQFRV